MAHVAVIGSGIAGLAVSIRLALQGHQVTVWEQQPAPGGKIAERYLERCRFDAGPSLLTWPQLLDELFELAGQQPQDHLQYYRLPLICTYFFSDGIRLQAHADPEAFGDEVMRLLQVPKHRIKKYLTDSARLFRATGGVFLQRSLHDPRTYFTRHALLALLNLHRLKAFSTLHQHNQCTLAEPHLVQLFDRYATYNGSDPYRAPATLRVIPHLEYNTGAYFPAGGMYAIIRALHRLAERCGVTFRFQTPVNRLFSGKKVIGGISTDVSGNRLHWDCDLVVSNADVAVTCNRLLDDAGGHARLRVAEPSSSALVFFWVLNRTFADLHLHNIFFSSDYKAEFEALRRGRLPDQPTVYVNISCRENPSDAPPGYENWFVLVNAPPHTNQDWSAMVAHARDRVLQIIQRALGTTVDAHIVAESVMTPADLERRTASPGGALYGSSSNHWKSAFLRHPNFSSHYGNLYFCGGSVHPGGGIPLCLLSAKITAGLISRRHG